MGEPGGRAHHAARPPLRVHAPEGREDEGVAGLLHEAQLRLELLRPPAVVGVEKGEPPAPRRADAGVARRRRPAVDPVPQHPHAPVPRRVRLRQIPRAVRRAVIDQQQLPVGHGLGQNGLRGLRQRRARVPDRRDHRDRRSRAHCSIRWLACRRSSQAPITKVTSAIAHDVGHRDVLVAVDPVEPRPHHADDMHQRIVPQHVLEGRRHGIVGEEDPRDQEHRPRHHPPDVLPGRKEPDQHAVERADAQAQHRRHPHRERHPRRVEIDMDVLDHDDRGEQDRRHHQHRQRAREGNSPEPRRAASPPDRSAGPCSSSPPWTPPARRSCRG